MCVRFGYRVKIISTFAISLVPQDLFFLILSWKPDWFLNRTQNYHFSRI